jgi:transcriptional regulator with XRE-family HTH domain
VTKKSGKMNTWERDICSRLKAVRENLKWSQKEFSESLGITRNQLASIECGRTPVRYDVAWAIRDRFKISLKWLESGEGFADGFMNDNLPSSNDTGLPKRALLSQVVRKTSNGAQEGDLPKDQEQLFAAVISMLEGAEKTTGKEDVQNRELLESQLKILVEGWIARAPVGHAYEFTNKLNMFAESLLREFGQDAPGVADARGERIMWERIRNATTKKLLTWTSLKGKYVAGMKTEIQKLIERVKRKASKPGAKVALAKELDVAPARISEWLSGEKEPGGDYTLRLLRWVEQQ